MKKEDLLFGTDAEKLAIAKRFLAAELLADEFQKAGLAEEIDRLTEILHKPGANPEGSEADLRASLQVRYKDLIEHLAEIAALSRLSNLAQTLVNSQ